MNFRCSLPEIRCLSQGLPHAIRSTTRALAAQAGLDGSKNVWVLGNAAYMFQSQYNQTLQSGAPNGRAAELAERYFLRAKALEPKLRWRISMPSRFCSVVH
jgi:hypothetical protein